MGLFAPFAAGKNWAFYSVSGEIPARSAGKFWGICVASVKFCSLGPCSPSRDGIYSVSRSLRARGRRTPRVARGTATRAAQRAAEVAEAAEPAEEAEEAVAEEEELYLAGLYLNSLCLITSCARVSSSGLSPEGRLRERPPASASGASTVAYQRLARLASG